MSGACPLVGELLGQPRPCLLGRALKLQRGHRYAAGGDHFGLAVHGIRALPAGDMQPAVVEAARIDTRRHLHRFH
jgi:hypothetical protein